METIHIRLENLLRADVVLTRFPSLTSSHRWVKKGIDLTEKHLPRLARYLSREQTLGKLEQHRLVVSTSEPWNEERVRLALALWLKRLRLRRFFFVLLEALAMPVTGFMALLPGPNIFFYGLFVLFFFHLTTWIHHKKVSADRLDIRPDGP